ncbi:MAG: tail fiber domain-containing protein [Saprospiraceae bacterium]|jgi:hypothetical protein|nr:tail fiber domain-containing protein [Saprospiraceae bacterium]
MTKILSALLFVVFTYSGLTAQVGINTGSPHASAALDVTATDKGLLIPRVALASAIGSPAEGLMVYQTTAPKGFYYFNGTAWTNLGGGTASELEKITEGANTGHRILGRDPANYGDIGSNAVDLSYSFDESSTMGATGDYSTAIGQNTTASGYFSTAMGSYTSASGSESTAMGSNTNASGNNSTAMGNNTYASGSESTAMGSSTNASGNYSTAMGSYTSASGSESTAMGNSTNASGNYSTAMGQNTTASGYFSTAMGNSTTASNNGSTSMGSYTSASGDYSTAMGNLTTASGYFSTAMGNSTTASGSTSTAMGSYTYASGSFSTAMGNNTYAPGSFSTAMGYLTTASGDYSTAMGSSTSASGEASATMGILTNAKSYAEIAVGLNNTDYTPGSTSNHNIADRAFGVGIGGDETNRKDGLIVYKSGNTFVSNDGNTPDNGTTSIFTGTTNTAALQVRSSANGMNIRTPNTSTGINIAKATIPDNTDPFISFGHLNSGTYTSIGSITAASGTAVAYNTTSDRRLKIDNGTYCKGLSTLNQISIHDYTWKETQSKDIGVFAQELYKVFPGAVSKGDDKAENDPTKIEKRWQVDYSKLVPVLVAATQELAAKNQELEKELAIYKAKAKEIDAQLKEMASLKNDIDAIKTKISIGTQIVSTDK